MVVSLHDVAPATLPASSRWLDLVERHGMRSTLLVVAGPWRGSAYSASGEFHDWLHAAARRGHEVAVHGWEHRWVADVGERTSVTDRLRVRVVSRGSGEFATIGQAETFRRARLGLAALRSGGFDPVGFVPPAWMARRDHDVVLRALGFLYTTNRRQVRDLRTGDQLPVPSTSQRPRSAVTAVAAAANLRYQRHRLSHGAPLRIALHPDETSDARLVAAAEDVLRDAVAASYRGITYAELVAAVANEHIGGSE
jgi:predicted deacetylase